VWVKYHLVLVFCLINYGNVRVLTELIGIITAKLIGVHAELLLHDAKAALKIGSYLIGR
jgi:hypothetical protein